MKKFIILIAWGALIAGGIGLYVYRDEIFDFTDSLGGDAYNLVSREITDIEKRVITSTPLKSFESVSREESTLTEQGIIAETNRHRAEFGLPPLTFDSELKLAAQIKTEDMFKLDYFAHVSPTGVGPDGLAEMAGYEYFLIGENLAMGYFDGDVGLVQAWMNSPGHRENILNESYTEIGVYAILGSFEGDEVWIAVQEFGKPISDCPSIDKELQEEIEANRETIELMETELDEREEEIESHRPKHGEEYNTMIDEFNALANEYNSLVAETKEMIDIYNSQVEAFNACAQ